MDHHLSTGEPGNSRNGYGKKTVTTDASRMELEIPRDRQSTFDPQLIAKYQRRFPGFDDKIIPMYPRTRNAAMGRHWAMRQIETFVCEDRFRRECVDNGEPGVLRGGVSSWPAASTWTPQALAERVGDRPCDVAFSKSSVFDYNNATALRRRMTFREAAEQIVRNIPGDGAIYLMQTSLDVQFGELSADISPPSALSGAPAFPFFWFGAAGNVTPVHYDGVNNLYGQIFGRKRFTLFDPADTDALYPRPLASATSHLGSVDIENVDAARFPLYREARPICCDLAPGDLLFLPAFFWHHVRSLDTSISVNFWWAPRLDQCFVPAFLRQLRACYARDRLATIGSPIGDYPGGLAAATERAVQQRKPEFAALLAGAAIDALPGRQAGAAPDERVGLSALRAWLTGAVEPVVEGADCAMTDAAGMVADLTDFLAKWRVAKSSPPASG